MTAIEKFPPKGRLVFLFPNKRPPPATRKSRGLFRRRRRSGGHKRLQGARPAERGSKGLGNYLRREENTNIFEKGPAARNSVNSPPISHYSGCKQSGGAETRNIHVFSPPWMYTFSIDLLSWPRNIWSKHPVLGKIQISLFMVVLFKVTKYFFFSFKNCVFTFLWQFPFFLKKNSLEICKF